MYQSKVLETTTLRGPPDAVKKPQVQAFRQWLLNEIMIFKTQTGSAVD